MVRIEIITNQSVEEDILEAIDATIPGIYYTIFPNLMGRGRQGIRKGDSIWPEQNMMILLFCSEEEARKVGITVSKMKEHFPKEGIKLFQSNV